MVNGDNPIKYRVCSNVCPTDYLHYSGDLFGMNEALNETMFISHLDMRNITYTENHLTVVNFTDKNPYEIYDMAKKFSSYDNYLVPSINSKDFYLYKYRIFKKVFFF